MGAFPHEWITVHADASYNPKTREGGWAVWVRGGGGRIVSSGPCPDYVANAHHAELAAIYAGIHLAVKKFPEVTAILVRSDCQPALHNLQNLQVPNRNAVIERLRVKICEAAGPRLIKTKWVRGHDSGNTRESWVNNACDRMAREARLRARVAAPAPPSAHGNRRTDREAGRAAEAEPRSQDDGVEQRDAGGPPGGSAGSDHHGRAR